MKHILFALCTVLFAATLPVTAQKAISKKQWKKTTRVVYTYKSGSAIDPDKRDYTVSVDKNSIFVNVSCPDGSSGSMAFDSSPETLNNLKAALAKQGLGTIPDDQIGAIPLGGGMEYIDCYAGSDEAYYSTFCADRVGTLNLKKGEPFDAFEQVLPLPIHDIIRQVAPPKPREPKPVLIRRIIVSPEQWAETDFVRYSFIDSSTPPDCHRSYSIGINKDSIVVSVTSYGNLLLREVYPFTQEQFNAVKAHLAEQGFNLVPPTDEPLPPGGTSESVAFFMAGEDNAFFSGSVYAGIGTLQVEKGCFAEAFVRALPRSISEIIDSTRNNR